MNVLEEVLTCFRRGTDLDIDVCVVPLAQEGIVRHHSGVVIRPSSVVVSGEPARRGAAATVRPVSYTHLTLPTKA